MRANQWERGFRSCCRAHTNCYPAMLAEPWSSLPDLSRYVLKYFGTVFHWQLVACAAWQAHMKDACGRECCGLGCQILCVL